MNTQLIHKGDLTVSQDMKIDFQEITGHLVIEKGVKLVANKLKTVGGDLSINSNVELPKLETVGGDLSINSNVELPKLETVGGDLYINADAELPKLETVGGYLNIYADVELPKLETVGGDLSINADAELPKLETVGGDLYINADAELPKLETVGGYLSINSNVELDAPKLETVGGYLSINSNVELPKLETVGGDLYINADAELPKLETVGGYLNIYADVELPKLETVGGDLSINADAELPKLETVGGDLYINSGAELDAPKLKNKNDNTAKTICQAALDLSFKKKGLVKIDGILSWLFSKKKLKDLVVFKVKIVGKLKFSFIVERNNQFSHGETVKNAIESLRYKLTDRDTTRFKKWTITTKVSVEDAIQAYRAITGACELGVKNFCESIKVPKRIKISEVIKLTDGKYGHEAFEKFFK